MYPLAKTEVALNRVSAAQKQVRLCSTGIWGDTCLDDIIFNLHLRDVQSVLYKKDQKCVLFYPPHLQMKGCLEKRFPSPSDCLPYIH